MLEKNCTLKEGPVKIVMKKAWCKDLLERACELSEASGVCSVIEVWTNVKNLPEALRPIFQSLNELSDSVAFFETGCFY